jgi:acyl-coenzyme A synthetase/AMP-(fatty) acid ligase
MMMILVLLHENDVYVCHKKVKWHIMHIQEVYVIMIDGYIFLNEQWDRYWQSI